MDVPSLYQHHSLQFANLQGSGKVILSPPLPDPNHVAYPSRRSPLSAAPQPSAVLVGAWLPLSPGADAASQGMEAVTMSLG